MNNEEIIKHMGFEICEFEADSDICEACHIPYKQLYFQQSLSGNVGEGRYLCKECIIKEFETNQEILRILE